MKDNGLMVIPMAVVISTMQMAHISKDHLDLVMPIVMMEYLFILMDHLKEGNSEIQNLTEKLPSTIKKMDQFIRVNGRMIYLMVMENKSMMMVVTTRGNFIKGKKMVRSVNLNGEMARHIGVHLKMD